MVCINKPPEAAEPTLALLFTKAALLAAKGVATSLENHNTMKIQEVPKNPLNKVAPWASIVVASTATISLGTGIWSFNRNAEIQAQFMALSALQNYLNLAVQYPDLASRDNDHAVDARYAWFAANALNTAQTLGILAGYQADWQPAIDSIIRHHQPYLRSGLFVCDDFKPEFISYIRTKAEEVRCAVKDE